MTISKVRIRLTREVIRNLRDVSKLSSAKQWEYAGGFTYTKSKFTTPSRITSKKRNKVAHEEISKVWYSEISYHTHPGIGYSEDTPCQNTPIFTTLPSNADFEAYIKGFPQLQVNIICDSHGYYVIDILKSAYTKSVPLPEAVDAYMRKLRSRPFMRISAFSDEGSEYFQTTLKNWKTQINEEVSKEMLDLFGISIQYYTYFEDPPQITIYQGIDVV